MMAFLRKQIILSNHHEHNEHNASYAQIPRGMKIKVRKDGTNSEN